MNSVSLLYIMLDAEDDFAKLAESQVDQWMSELSLRKQASVKRLLHKRDRMTSLAATRLLKMCAQHEGVEDFQLSDVKYPDKGKPCWGSDTGDYFDFNLSHTDKLIIVAASKTIKVGIDAERIRELKNLNFKLVMSTDQLTEIRQTPGLFFDLWSKKEAVVKAANTVGLGRMRDVQLKQGHAVLDDNKWYLKNIELSQQLGNQYAIHLATSEPAVDVIIKQTRLRELI